MHFGEQNTLLVVVSNADRNDVLPVSTDANPYGGIYRDVELIVTPQTTVSPLYLGSDGVLIHQKSVSHERALGEAEVHLTAPAKTTSCTLTLDITDPDGTVVFSKTQPDVRLDGKPVNMAFAFDHPQLWSLDTTALYEISVGVSDGKTADAVTVRTGFRQVMVTPAGGFTINGVRVPLHGVTLYHDNLLSAGALTAADYDADLQQIEDVGANAIHSAVMPHAQYLYDRCDEQGLVAWVDLPLQRASFRSDISYYATPQFEQNGEEQLKEMIAQNMNHPSVVMWGIFSRMGIPGGDDVLPYVQKLNALAHTMDASRPTAACSDQDGRINFITDLVVWRQNIGWKRGRLADVALWRDKLQQNWSRLRSGVCYGGAGFAGQDDASANTGQPERRQTRLHEVYAKNLNADSLFWGVWVNNMFDYGSARRPYGVMAAGLVGIDRRTHKDAYFLYRALWNKREATLHLIDNRLRDGRYAFTLFSSAGRPQLAIDADTVALSEYAPCQYRSDTVSIRKAVTVRADAGALNETLRLNPAANALTPLAPRSLRQKAGR